MSIPGSVHPLFALGKNQYEIQRSLRFNSSDSAYLSRTPSTEGNRKTWTWAGWVKRTKLGVFTPIFTSGVQGTADPRSSLAFDSQGTGLGELSSGVNVNNTWYNIITSASFRDVSAWYHIVTACDTTQTTPANRMRLYVNGVEVTQFSSASYVTQDTLTSVNNTVAHGIGRYINNPSDGDANMYLAEVHFIDGAALTPSSFTETDATTGQLIPKTYTGEYGTNGYKLTFSDNSNNTAATLGADTSGRGNNWTPSSNISVLDKANYVSSGLSYRDSTSSNQNWNSSSTSSSTSNAIGVDRIWWVDLGSNQSFNRITFNVTGSGQSSNTSTNFITYFSTSASSKGSSICGSGCDVTSASIPSGTTPGSITVTFAGFASQTGRYIGITNGSSGAGGTYRYSNLQVSNDGRDNDSLVDTPTNYGTDTGAGGEVRGNYCTWNPLQKGANITLANGNLDVSLGANLNGSVLATIGMSSGKWYWEVTPNTGNFFAIGIAKADLNLADHIGKTSGWAYIFDGRKGNNNVYTSYGTSYTIGDVIGVTFDADNGTLAFYKNGTSQGNAYTGLIYGPYFPSWGIDALVAPSASANFGQRPFAYQNPGTNRPSADHKALCTQNLPEGSITTSGTFTGNSSADGPFVYLNGVPTAMTINGNAVTFGTHADKLSNGFKVRNSTSSYNTSGSNTYSISSTGAKFKVARAQANP
jgi:hypothetical protein